MNSNGTADLFSPHNKIALFSLYEPTDSLLFAEKLIRLGWQIVATQNVVDVLAKDGIKAETISDFVGIRESYPFPPTLHPKMELSLTTTQSPAIDLVYNTTYPLHVGNDVGGHTLLALAAKGSRIVVSNREDMAETVNQLIKNGSGIDAGFHRSLIQKTYAKIAGHYLSLSNSNSSSAEPCRIIPLKEGENPYQIPADLYVKNNGDMFSLGNFRQVSGDLPCFTNIADFDSILKVLCSLNESFVKCNKKAPFIMVAAKHGDPCGLAVDWDSPETAVDACLFGNPRAVWGGEAITNFPITGAIAAKLLHSQKRNALLANPNWMLDLIAAPSFDEQSINILGKRADRKLFANEALISPVPDQEVWAFRPVRGGNLRQPPNNYVLDAKDCQAEGQIPEPAILDSIRIAWATAWLSSHGGNEVAIAKNGKLLGVGGGPSTIDACATAVERAKNCGHDLRGSVFAADAFFPFTDAPEILVKAGCSYGLVPEGGKNFVQVKNYFRERGVVMLYLSGQFRGFCRH